MAAANIKSLLSREKPSLRHRWMALFTVKGKTAILVSGVECRGDFGAPPHLQVYPRMSKGATPAVADNALALDFDDFGS